jgi:hypothetical protein
MIYPMPLRRSLARSVVSLFLLAVGGRLGAQAGAADSTPRDPHAVQPERPTVATHAGTVAPGWVELEDGGEWDRASNGARSFVAPSNLKIGLASRAQLNLLFNLVHNTLFSGPSLEMGDLTVGVKYRIVEDDRILGDFAVLPALKLPTGAQNAGTGTTDFSLLLISSRQVGPVAIDLNVGQTRRTGDGSAAAKIAGIWTASFGFPVTGPIGGTLEVFGYPRTTGPQAADAIAAVLVGPTVLAREWLALDAGIIVPITGPQPRALYTGFVWNFGCIAPRRVCHER